MCSVPRFRFPDLTCAAGQYGKDLDWKKEHYTTHDVASVFRRYLTQMPVSSCLNRRDMSQLIRLQEPVIPHAMYDRVSAMQPDDS